MTTPAILVILLLCSLSSQRELRNDYNYNYESGDWDNYEYNYQWAHQEQKVEKRGEAFWREICRQWKSEEIYLEGDKEDFSLNKLINISQTNKSDSSDIFPFLKIFVK